MRVAGPEMRRAEPSNEILYYWHEHGRPLEIVGFDLKRTVRNIQSVGHLRIDAVLASSPNRKPFRSQCERRPFCIQINRAFPARGAVCSRPHFVRCDRCRRTKLLSLKTNPSLGGGFVAPMFALVE
jgi:hypothetical protein